MKVSIAISLLWHIENLQDAMIKPDMGHEPRLSNSPSHVSSWTNSRCRRGQLIRAPALVQQFLGWQVGPDPLFGAQSQSCSAGERHAKLRPGATPTTLSSSLCRFFKGIGGSRGTKKKESERDGNRTGREWPSERQSLQIAHHPHHHPPVLNNFSPSILNLLFGADQGTGQTRHNQSLVPLEANICHGNHNYIAWPAIHTYKVVICLPILSPPLSPPSCLASPPLRFTRHCTCTKLAETLLDKRYPAKSSTLNIPTMGADMYVWPQLNALPLSRACSGYTAQLETDQMIQQR